MAYSQVSDCLYLYKNSQILMKINLSVYRQSYLILFIQMKRQFVLLYLARMLKQNRQTQIKLVIKCLENILAKTESQGEKDKLRTMIKKIDKNREKKEVKNLDQHQYKLYSLYMDGFNSCKQSFSQLIEQEQFKIIAEEKFDFVDYLINLQPKFILPKENQTIDGLCARYTSVGILPLKKLHQSWPKEFTKQIIDKLKQKMKKKEEAKKAQINLKPAPRQVQVNNQEDNQSSEQSESQVKQPPPKKPIQRPIEPAITRPNIKQPEKPAPKYRIEPRNQPIKQAKSKSIQIQKYLQGRKDLTFEKGRMKDIAEFLATELQRFMKYTLEKIIDISSLKSKKNPRIGNQLTYFAPQNQRIIVQTPFYVQPNSKIFSLGYKHKLQYYTNLRMKQLKKQDELRSALETKTNEGDKKVDKKIENYILKPRPKQVQPVQLWREEKQFSKPTFYSINTEHVTYYLQNHRFLRNSLLLFNSYHY